MPSIQVTGQLVDPTTGVEGGADIRIASLINYGQTTKKSISHKSTDASGNYDFQLVYGKHLIFVKYEDERIYIPIGYAVVGDITPDPIDLIQLINLSDENPPSELVTELQQLREDTLNDIVDTSAQVLENAGYQGEWVSGTSTALKGETWQVSGRYYVALKNTSVDPINDNDNWREDVTTDYVTTAQNDIVDGSIFKGSNGETVENGDVVEPGTTHLRVLVGGKPNIVAMSPVASGVVSLLTDNSATIGGTAVKLRIPRKIVQKIEDIDFALTPINEILAGQYSSSTSVQIIAGNTLKGQGRDVINTDNQTTINFVGDGIVLGNGDYVNDAEVSELRLVGDGSAGIGLNLLGAITTPVNESTFKRLRIEDFAVGFQSLYAWSNYIEQLRIQNCTKSFEIQSQNNNTTFTQFNASGGSQTSRFVNAEGIYLESMNWVNQTATTTLSLSQSYVTINNPYFENLSGNVLIGLTNDVNPSSLSLKGGLIAGNFLIGKNGVSLEIDGCRNSATQSLIGTSNGLPDRYCTIKVNSVALGDSEPKMNFRGWHLYTDSKENILWPGASGGSIRFSRLYRDYYEFEQQAVNNGINIASDLTIGEQYCLVVCMRRQSGTGILSVRAGSTTLQFPDKACPSVDDGGEFVVRHLPFVATAADLELLFTGKIEIKGIAISKGIASSGDVGFLIDKPWRSNSMPTQGDWIKGDYVENTDTVVMGASPSEYTISGWRRITTGSGNVLNTDWVEVQAQTGT